METLHEAAIASFLEACDNSWTRDGDAIVRRFKAASAREAVRKLDRIADLSEGANHHPELLWVYDSLTIRLTTHDAGGITAQDTHLARCIDDVLDA